MNWWLLFFQLLAISSQLSQSCVVQYTRKEIERKLGTQGSQRGGRILGSLGKNSPVLPDDPPYTCDSILGDSLCPLEMVNKTVEVEGITIHYYIYQVLKQ